MSTSLALLQLTEEIITSALDSKQCTIGVFIDLKKAFDTIDYTLLLRKLRGVSSDWLTSHLTNRLQYVSIDDCDSLYIMNVTCSIIGPNVFALYINDICNISV